MRLGEKERAGPLTYVRHTVSRSDGGSGLTENVLPPGVKVTDAARVAGVSPATIYRFVREKKLQAYNAGERLTRVTTASLERFLEQAKTAKSA